VNPKKLNKKTYPGSNSVWFLLLSTAAVTLFFKTDFYDPFNSAKLILLLLLDCWLLGQLINSYKSGLVVIKSLEFLVILTVALFICTLLISTFQTESFNVALLGETQRRNGFLAYLGLSLILLYAARSINFSNINSIYKTGIALGSILSTYGIMQLSGRDFQSWDNPYNAMIGTLGNPNFASSMLAILVMLGIYGLFNGSMPIIFKLLSFYLIGAGLFAIIGSNSRQGLIVILFSLTFYSIVYGFIKNKLLGIVAAFLGGTLILFVTLGMLRIGPLTSIIYKESLSVRGYYWRAGIEMFKSSPIFGVGVDRYGTFFKQFREFSYPQKFGYELTSTNAHNTFIQLFATAGLFVGTIYLALLVFIFASGISVLRQSEMLQKKQTLGLLATWLGFQSQSLISIDNIGISIWGWLLGGAILGLKFSKDLPATFSKSNQSRSNDSKKVKINLIQPFVAACVLIPVLVLIVPFYKSETTLLKLRNISASSSQQNKELALQYANELLNYKVIDPSYKYMSAFYLNDLGYKDVPYKIVLDQLRNDPINPDFLRGAAALEEYRLNIPGAILIRERIVAVDPWNYANYLELMKLYKANNELPKAKLVQEKILKFIPETEIAKSAKEILS
jgi:O-antigen ligase